MSDETINPAVRISAPGPVSPDDVENKDLVERIRQGDRGALGEMFALYRPRLWRMVTFRLHPNLQGRIDADDVLQDAWLRAVDRIEHFYDGTGESSFLWFRGIVIQTLVDLHRFHLGAQKRSAVRELSIETNWATSSTSSCLAYHLSDSARSPSSDASRAELTRRLDSVLLGMNEVDRENGQVIVTDFGIGDPAAGRRDSRLSWVQNGYAACALKTDHALDGASEQVDSDEHMIGTLRYMAPERLNGIGDSRSDIYSLGATLYELATQVPAFEIQERSKLIQSILHQQPPRPQCRHAEIPAPLEFIILKAMAKSPADRYQTARALAEDLRRFINRQPIKAAEHRIWHRAIAWYHGWARSWRRDKL